MISIIYDLIKSGLSFFQKKQEKEVDKSVVTTQETNETNREEIKKGFSGRNFMFYVLGTILAWNYILVPLLDYFGIVLFSLPLGEIFSLLSIMLGGG
ncbi:hypothetical protein H2359_002995 [Salmonella enterica]|uniref:hypothetical protein n=1 Tax=Enterobacteriaceae TaxID=543 RepID=UPI0012D60833|nr:hypothetical protein [Citrobacter sp. Cpo090]EAY3776861.1 hypothetical protein [Salmonella enterica]ECV4233651.1 hypothetical protein [Salmonella enterica subsp. enterica serovar Urbana]HCX6037524.1 hypothetical protein [Escherichia coli]EAZ5519981.1 hypothetical protein [Salmonella enterica]EBB1669500.1 hypothetical protein [Salmonella enterica]